MELKIGIKERTAARRKRIVAHRAASFEDAENLDLDFWQSQAPEQRLSALVAFEGTSRKLNKHDRKPKDARGTRPEYGNQWKLYCMVHNFDKLMRYAPGFA